MHIRLERRISIDRRVATKDATYGAAAHDYQPYLAGIWAERRDFLPSRSDRLAEGGVLEQQENQVRYRFRWRDGIDSSMRIREGDRTFQIVGGPAELGRKEFIEVVCTEFGTTGGAEPNGT